MQDRHIVTTLLIALVLMLIAPTSVTAAHPPTGLEPLVNEWRVELGLAPLREDERLYAAAEDIAGDGTYCPQDRIFVEFAIGGALYRAGYRDKRGFSLLLCGEYPTPEHVMERIRQGGGPSHRDLEDISVVHLANLNFVRSNDRHVSDIWVLLAGDPVE